MEIGPSCEPPRPIAAGDDISRFDCGDANLNTWLRERALKNQHTGASRTFVACEGRRVRAFYALAASALVVAQAPGRLKRNMPDPIPMVLLARLGVDQELRGFGFGRALVRNAALRVLRAGPEIGVRGILVNAKSASANAFYGRIGFTVSPSDPMLLVTTLADLRCALQVDK